MATRKRRSQWATDAALQALVRFGPEQSGLRELQRQARENRDLGVAQAHGTAAGIVNAVDVARPQVASIYDRAGLEQARTASSLRSETSRLGPIANSIRGAIELEQAQGARHLREEGAASLTDLSTRRVQARQGEQFAVQSAQRQFVTDLTKLLARKQDLAREKGAFTASTIGQLEESALGRQLSARNSARSARQSERNSVRQTGIDPDTGKPIPGGKLDPKVKAKARKTLTATGAKAATANQHTAFASQVHDIASQAAKYKGTLSRQQIVAKLTKGRPAVRVTVDPDTGQKLANPVSIPAIKSVKPDVAMTAALDLALDGHLSRATQRRLQKTFRVKDLDLTTYGDWRRTAGPDAGLSYDERRRRRLQAGRSIAGLIPATR